LIVGPKLRYERSVYENEMHLSYNSGLSISKRNHTRL
jgi:hypothetical protein